MDHYKTLGLHRSATKEEIKEAFRRSALKFHPDRHSQSSKDVKEGASLKFKQASEAYEVLIDDRKRADYDFAWRSGSTDRWSRGASSSSASYSYSSQYQGGRQYSYGYRRTPTRDGAVALDLDMLFRLMTRRGFLVSIAFASALLGGAIVAEKSIETIWKMNNSGNNFCEELLLCEMLKRPSFCHMRNNLLRPRHAVLKKSFEEAMESIEQIKSQKENR